MTRLNLAPWTHSLLIATGLLSLAGMVRAADSPPDGAGTYVWSAKLVEFDAADRAVTVESLVAADSALDDASSLKPGDRAMLTWSGLFRASGVRSVTPGTRSEHDRLTLPIEFVSTEMGGRYVRFKVPVPEADVAAIESLSPGEWVTATSPHQAAGPSRAVSSIKPYNSNAAS